MNKWEWAHTYWSSHRDGAGELVKKIKYLGLRGYNNYIMYKIHDGIKYAGEVWECETKQGAKKQFVFRIPAEEAGERPNYQNPNLKKPLEFRELPNYHTDGILAYTTGIPGLIDRRQLKLETNKLRLRISNLKEVFKNTDNRELKLGIQLFLRRLETPDHYTSKYWKQFSKKNPILQSRIVDISYGKLDL